MHDPIQAAAEEIVFKRRRIYPPEYPENARATYAREIRDTASILRRHLGDREAELQKALADAAFHLGDAAESIGHWGAYADDYFQKKHDLSGDVARFKKYAGEASNIVEKTSPKVGK